MESRAAANAKRRINVPARVWLGFFIALAATPATGAELTPAFVNSAEPLGKIAFSRETESSRRTAASAAGPVALLSG